MTAFYFAEVLNGRTAKIHFEKIIPSEYSLILIYFQKTDQYLSVIKKFKSIFGAIIGNNY